MACTKKNPGIDVENLDANFFWLESLSFENISSKLVSELP